MGSSHLDRTHRQAAFNAVVGGAEEYGFLQLWSRRGLFAAGHGWLGPLSTNESLEVRSTR